MIVGDLMRILDETLPSSWAEDWDNVGLLLGDSSEAVNGIAIALDASLEALRMTLEHSCSVLLTHHPFIFQPIKRIECAESTGALIAFALRHGISIIALHTNWDVAPCGVNTAIARALGLEHVAPLIPSERGAWGLGAFGTLHHPLSFEECGVLIRDTLRLSRLELHGDPKGKIAKMALCGGSGGSLWKNALEAGSDLYFTADMKYHERLEALENGLEVVLADHGEMERFSLEALAELVSKVAGEETTILEIPAPQVRVL